MFFWYREDMAHTKIYKNKRELIEGLITRDDEVLDVGFWGQGLTLDDPCWVHTMLKARSRDVHGVDLVFDEKVMEPRDHYQKVSAEEADFGRRFDVVFAADVIEHLVNPGLFLEGCKKQLADGGRLIITTPNCFNLFNIFEKIKKSEPTVNSDHVAYYNTKTIKVLLKKSGFEVREFSYLYSLEIPFKESLSKKIQNILYRLLSLVTPKFIETLVVVAVPKE